MAGNGPRGTVGTAGRDPVIQASVECLRHLMNLVSLSLSLALSLSLSLSLSSGNKPTR